MRVNLMVHIRGFFICREERRGGRKSEREKIGGQITPSLEM
jgi:hypothetical protein